MKRSRVRLYYMLDYIERKEKEIIKPLELIAYFIPSMYELNLVYNKTYGGKYHNITVSLSDPSLKGAIRKAYELKHNQNFSGEMIFKYLNEN